MLCIHLAALVTLFAGCAEPPIRGMLQVADAHAVAHVAEAPVEERGREPGADPSQGREEYVRRAVIGRPLPAEVIGKRQRGSGSGFFVGRQEVVTNHHVIDGCGAVTVRLHGRGDWWAANVVGSDGHRDLAVVRAAGATDQFATFRAAALAARPPEQLTIIGYPELGHVVVKPVVVKARPEISDLLAGRPAFRLRGTVRHGMSGSPVLDEQGRVLGVISRRVNPLARYRATGELPDVDIGLAVSTGVVLEFLREHRIEFRQEDVSSARRAAGVPLEVVPPYVAQIGCWN